jgi:hypothetical protein
MSKTFEFVNVFRQYRRYHGTRYALRSAWRIAVQGLPF